MKVNKNEIFNMYFGIIEDKRCEVNVIPGVKIDFGHKSVEMV